MTTTPPPLTGLRVLDLGRHPASALASMVLADFGALLAELGYDAAAIAQLHADNVVWSEPVPLPKPVSN